MSAQEEGAAAPGSSDEDDGVASNASGDESTTLSQLQSQVL